MHEIVVVARDGGEVKIFLVEFNYATYFYLSYIFLSESLNTLFANRYHKRQVRLLPFELAKEMDKATMKTL